MFCVASDRPIGVPVKSSNCGIANRNGPKIRTRRIKFACKMDGTFMHRRIWIKLFDSIPTKRNLAVPALLLLRRQKGRPVGGRHNGKEGINSTYDGTFANYNRGSREETRHLENCINEEKFLCIYCND